MPAKTVRTGGRKKGGQKYQNVDGYKRDKWGTNEHHKKIQATPIGAVCTRCHDKIEWKIRYNKYKQRSAPGRCEKCKNKTIRHAYHRACLACGEKESICCMCCERKDDIIPLPETEAEIIKAELEGEAALMQMRERERRTYLRRLQEDEDASEDEDEEDDEGEGEGDDDSGGEGGEDGSESGGVLPVASLTLDNLARHDAGKLPSAAGGEPKEEKQNDWEADLSDDDDDSETGGGPDPPP